MKQLFTTITFLCLMTVFAIAQTNVKLEFNHKQGSQDLKLNQVSATTGGESYNAYRLEYYIAEVALEHDGGQITALDSFWILVNALNPATYDLGQFNITNFEAIYFSIGVQQAFNHLDLNKWPVSHPLGPKSPSMHWGWSAGYRFFAMEGKCGSSVNYVYEFHSLGDQYYFDQRIETAGADVAGDLVITLNADYDRVFDGLTLGTGLIEHGNFPKNIITLENLRDRVFTSYEGNGNSLSPIVGLNDVNQIARTVIYPNPSAGVINIASDNLDLTNADLIVYDYMGKVIFQKEMNSWNGLESINIDQNGFYVLSIDRDGKELIRETIAISK